MSVTDIKDREPNYETIEQLEELLKQAQAGRLRTVITVCGWDDDSFSAGWVIDPRNTRLRIVGQMTMTQHNVVDAMNMDSGDSVIVNNLTDA